MIKTFQVSLIVKRRRLYRELLTKYCGNISEIMFALNVTVISSEAALVFWNKMNETIEAESEMEIVHRVINERFSLKMYIKVVNNNILTQKTEIKTLNAL